MMSVNHCNPSNPRANRYLEHNNTMVCRVEYTLYNYIVFIVIMVKVWQSRKISDFGGRPLI